MSSSHPNTVFSGCIIPSHRSSILTYNLHRFLTVGQKTRSVYIFLFYSAPIGQDLPMQAVYLTVLLFAYKLHLFTNFGGDFQNGFWRFSSQTQIWVWWLACNPGFEKHSAKAGDSWGEGQPGLLKWIPGSLSDLARLSPQKQNPKHIEKLATGSSS